MPADRLHRLIHVAAEEFATAGYDGASLNRIIDKCGLSKSSFYYVISSKQELFELVVRELVGEVAATMTIPEPEEFAGDSFWPRIEKFFSELVLVSQQQESFLTLGRLFYSEAPDAASGAVGGTLAAVRTWVEDVLRVGRRCGAVRDDLPETLQYSLVFRILQVFDEWTIGHYDDFRPADLQRLADAQLATIRRVLEP